MTTDRTTQYLDGSPTYEHVSVSGRTYHLSRNSTAARNAGSEWSCDCMSWIIQKNRPCKHLKADKRMHANQEVLTWPAGERRVLLPEIFPSRGLKEVASARKVAKRVETEGRKAVKLGALRYGFQLAHAYSKSDFVPGQMVAEVKYDGILGMLVDGRIVNRSGNDVTNRFPEIGSTDKAVLVGEVVVLKPDGTSDFHTMQERSTDDPLKVRLRSRLTPATFVAFDVLELNGKDLTDNSFGSRRVDLEWFLSDNPIKGVKLIEQLVVRNDGEVQRLVEACREMEAEGVMVKRLDATYVAKRGKNWMKAKTWQEEEFDVVKFGETGVGKGFTIFVQSGRYLQEVTCNGLEMRRRIEAGHRRVEVKFLSKSAEGAMRFPTLRRLV